jgi:hypothetical protein
MKFLYHLFYDLQILPSYVTQTVLMSYLYKIIQANFKDPYALHMTQNFIFSVKTNKET